MILDDFTSFFLTEFSKSKNNRSQTSGITWRLSEIWLIMPLEVSNPKEFRNQLGLREQSFRLKIRPVGPYTLQQKLKKVLTLSEDDPHVKSKDA